MAESATGYHSSSGSALPVAVTATDLAGLWVGLVGAVIYASRRWGTSSLSADFGWRIGAWWDLPVGAVIGLACQYGLIPLVYLPFEHVDRKLSNQMSQPAHKEAGAAHSLVPVVVLLLFLAVGAPLVEELFFRGLLLRSLMRSFPPVAAVLVSAVLFGLAHFEAVQFGGLALFGVVLALLAWRTHRLAPSIGAHISFNAAAVLTTVHLH